jgi:hypothetical protein
MNPTIKKQAILQMSDQDDTIVTVDGYSHGVTKTWLLQQMSDQEVEQLFEEIITQLSKDYDEGFPPQELKAEIIHYESGQRHDYVITEVKRTSIEANTEDELFAKFFKMFNGLKYLNDVSVKLADPKLEAKFFDVWIKDINNWANNGGDLH